MKTKMIYRDFMPSYVLEVGLLESNKRGAWLAQSVHHVALDLSTISSSPILGMEPL